MNNVMNVMNSMNSISTVQLLRSGTSPSFRNMKPTLQGGTCSSVAALRHLYQSNMQAVTRIAQLRTTRSEVLPQSSQLHHKKGDIPPRAGIFLPWQKWNGKFLPSPVHSTPTNELWNMTDELWTMKYDLWTMIYELRSVNSEFRTMNYELWTMNYELWAINYELWTMNYELWTLNYELWAPSYEPLQFPALGTVTRSDTAFGQVMAKY